MDVFGGWGKPESEMDALLDAVKTSEKEDQSNKPNKIALTSALSSEQTRSNIL